MPDALENLSPAHSDDGLTFQDAADGSSTPEVSIKQPVDDKSKKLQQAVDGPTEESLQTASPSAAISASPSSSKASKNKGSGVAALMARFQNGVENANAGPSNQADARIINPKSINRAARQSRSIDIEGDGEEVGKEGMTAAVVQPSLLEEEQPAHIDETSMIIEQHDEIGIGLGLDDAIGLNVLKPDKEELPPSIGATSLLDPNEMIKNPFRGDKTPTLDNPLSTFEQSQLTQQQEADIKRYSASSTKQETEYDPETPVTSQTNRFSTVTLSTPVNPRETRPETSSGSASADAEFVVRQSAKLNRAVEGDQKRSSMDGAERIKERVRELRYGHSRESSIARKGEEGEYGLHIVHDAVQEESEATELAEIPLQEGEAIDWDFWGNVMSNYQEIAQEQPRQLSQAIQAGIPGALRGMMWQLMSSSKDEEMEIIYAYYLKQTSPHEKMIRKDLARTFPGQDYFRDGKGIGQENLFNVVKAYSLYDEECGYCQGMQFVVGPLLLNMPDEEAFSTLVRLMKSYDLRGHFIPNMPGLQLRLYQFDRLLEETLPLLHRHLVRSGVKSSMYASGWFMTLFSYRSPLEICFRIFDSVFAEGIEALFRFAIALMKKNEEDLLNMAFEEAVPLLAVRIFDAYKSKVGDEGHEMTESQDEKSGGAPVSGGYRVNEFVRDAFDMKITAFQLDSYSSDFAEEIRLANSHRREMDELKLQNRSLQAKVKNLEDQLGAVQQEHVDLVKNVVMAKLAKEEMAEEVCIFALSCCTARHHILTFFFLRRRRPSPPACEVQADVRRGDIISRSKWSQSRITVTFIQFIFYGEQSSYIMSKREKKVTCVKENPLPPYQEEKGVPIHSIESRMDQTVLLGVSEHPKQHYYSFV